MKKYIKTEREDLFEPNIYISMIIKLKGDISTEQLKTAIESAYENNESTMSRIVLESDGSAYYEKMEASGCKVYIDDRKWQDILVESQKKPFALWDGELIRSYITKAGDNTTLFIHSHHLAGDGKGVLYFIEQILKKLSGEDLTYQPLVLLDDKWLSSKPKLPFAI